MHPCETCERPLAKSGNDICDDCAKFGEGPHEGERAHKAAHGGYRDGAGRKPILDNASTYAFKLTAAHLTLLDQWATKHKLDTRSAALRHLIETSTKKR